eukprot:gene4513-5627_t
MQNKTLTIVGAGLSGCTLALLLGKAGYNIDVVEKRPRENDPAQRARSINLALSERGINTLKQTYCFDEIEKIAIPMKGRMVHTIDGQQNFQPYSSDTEKHLFSVSRQLLNEKLRDHAEKLPNVSFSFNQQFSEFNIRKELSKNTTYIGCDGAFSAIRSSMTKLDRQEYSQSFLEHGYKELSIPAGENSSWLLDKNCLHIWPRNSYMMIALPNIDGSFTCTLFFPFECKNGGESFQSLNSNDKVVDFFKKIFPDAFPLMPTLTEDFFANPTSSLVTVRTFPWYHQDKAVLVGDAAHAIVPFYGQGMNAAFEDCLELYSTFLRLNPDPLHLESKTLVEIYKSYQDRRKMNSDAIAEMAIENFIEMRDSVVDPLFVFKKKVEHLLEKTFPNRYVSRYELISFSTVPYATAQHIGRMNQLILSELTKDNPDFDITKIDLVLADTLIKKHLNK